MSLKLGDGFDEREPDPRARLAAFAAAVVASFVALVLTGAVQASAWFAGITFAAVGWTFERLSRRG